jgi:hypothetical protein
VYRQHIVDQSTTVVSLHNRIGVRSAQVKVSYASTESGIR